MGDNGTTQRHHGLVMHLKRGVTAAALVAADGGVVAIVSAQRGTQRVRLRTDLRIIRVQDPVPMEEPTDADAGGPPQRRTDL